MIRLIKDGPCSCQICNKEFKRSNWLNRHLKTDHNIEMREYLIQYLLHGEIPKCKCGCGEDVTFYNNDIVEYLYGHSPKITSANRPKNVKWNHIGHEENDWKLSCTTCSETIQYESREYFIGVLNRVETTDLKVRCEDCLKKNRIEKCGVKKKYSENPEDWIRICDKCGSKLKCKNYGSFANYCKGKESGKIVTCNSCAQTGKTMSDEFREKCRNKEISEETRQKHSENTKNRYANMTEEEHAEVSRIQTEANRKRWEGKEEEKKLYFEWFNELARNISPEKKIAKGKKISEIKIANNIAKGSIFHFPEEWRIDCSECQTPIQFDNYNNFHNRKSATKKRGYIHCDECKARIKKENKLLGLHRKNLRKNRFEHYKFQPYYNKNTIPFIVDILNVRYNTEFIHAECEGGEFRVYDENRYTHYFSDAYCPNLNIWIEFDEPHHFKKGGILREECQIREDRIRECIPDVTIHRIYFNKENHNSIC